jgi:molecular chaperone GrpE
MKSKDKKNMDQEMDQEVDVVKGSNPEKLLESLEEERDVLRARCEKMKTLLEEKEEQHLRARADLENFRKRSLREKQQAQLMAKRDLLTAILPMMDALDLAIKHGAETADSSTLLEGVKAARDSVELSLASQNVERIVTEGNYSVDLHQADIAIPSSQHQDGEIIEELRSGYRIGEFVARHASVIVAKNPQVPAENIASEAEFEETDSQTESSQPLPAEE